MDGPDGIQPGLTYYPESEVAAVKLAEMLADNQAGAVALHCPNGLIADRGKERVLAAFRRVPDNYAKPVSSGDISKASGTEAQADALQAKGR